MSLRSLRKSKPVALRASDGEPFSAEVADVDARAKGGRVGVYALFEESEGRAVDLAGVRPTAAGDGLARLLGGGCLEATRGGGEASDSSASKSDPSSPSEPDSK